MTTKHQKELEKFYAEKTGELLGESWTVEPSPDEVDWPDLIISTESKKFGLEVREIYLDEEDTGSEKKREESSSLRKIKSLADDYYKTTCSSVKADFLGNINHHDKLLKAILRQMEHMSELEKKRIEPYKGCVVHIEKLPDRFGEYKRWKYIDDRVGWVSNMDKNSFDSVIKKKAMNLVKYKKNISDVRLLLVSNRIFNSGKARLSEHINCNTHGFNKVYYLSDPEVWQFNC